MTAGSLCAEKILLFKSQIGRSFDVIYELAIGAAINLILSFVKNPQHREGMRKAMLKVYRIIQSAYPNDPEFSINPGFSS